MQTQTRMTLSEHVWYPIDKVRKFLGLGPNTNISNSAYPALIGIRGLGYEGCDIIAEIKGRNGSTEVKTRWYDFKSGGYRAEIAHC